MADLITFPLMIASPCYSFRLLTEVTRFRRTLPAGLNPSYGTMKLVNKQIGSSMYANYQLPSRPCTSTTSFSLQPEDDTAFGFQTWYLSQRFVEVPSDPYDWDDLLLMAWRGQIDTEWGTDFYIVTPRPYEMEQRVIAHILLVQHANLAADVLQTIFDTAVHDGRAIRFAYIHGTTMFHKDLLHHSDRTVVCSWPDVSCTSWFGWHDITRRPLLDVQNGLGFTLAVQRRTRSKIRQTLFLENLIPEADNVDTTPILPWDVLFNSTKSNHIVHLLNGTTWPNLPSFLEMRWPCQSEDVEKKLHAWGFECWVGLIPHSGLVLCLESTASHCGVHYIYHKDDKTNPKNIFFMSSERPLSSLEHMKRLYAFGFCKAVVLDLSEIASGIWKIRFAEPQATY